MELAAAPVTATTGALKPVVAKLAALMGDEHKGLKGVCVESNQHVIKSLI
jgi:hypothetical protein